MRRLLLALAFSGCGSPSIAHPMPPDDAANRAVTDMWRRDILRYAQDGDVLLSRSYSLRGDVIVAATPGESVTHSSILDVSNRQVIQATGKGVHAAPLSSIVNPRNRYLILLRFTNQSQEMRQRGLAKARSKIGAKYDYGGLIAVDDPDKYTCSELIYWAFSLSSAKGQRRHFVVAPSDLARFGETIYYTGRRENESIREAALAATNERKTIKKQ